MAGSLRAGMRGSSYGSALASVVIALALVGCGSAASHSTTTANCPPGQVPVGQTRACAPSSASSSITTTPQPAATAQSSESASPLALGQSADFAGDEIIGSGAGEQASLTVQRVIDPFPNPIVLGTPGSPPAGQRYVGVELTIQSTGTAPYSDSPGMEMSLISKSTNGPVGEVGPGVTGAGQCATDLSEGVNIAPGQTERGCVVFQVPSDQQISAVQYQTQDGEGGNLATWNVP
jgi:hypothetical protein